MGKASVCIDASRDGKGAKRKNEDAGVTTKKIIDGR